MNETLLGIPSSGVFQVKYSGEPINRVELERVYELNSSTIDSLVFSEDGNEIVMCEFVETRIKVFSMCNAGTYYA